MFYKNTWAKKQSNSSTTYILESKGDSNWLEKHENQRQVERKKMDNGFST
jgi:hypothetical protein